jgi:hypothetical protein
MFPGLRFCGDFASGQPQGLGNLAATIAVWLRSCSIHLYYSRLAHAHRFTAHFNCRFPPVHANVVPT